MSRLPFIYISIVSVLLYFSHLYGLEPVYSLDTYNAKPITVNNIHLIGPQQIPDHVITKVKQFFYTNKLLSDTLITQAWNEQSAFSFVNSIKQNQKNAHMLLATYSHKGLEYIKNKANYILRLPGLKDYFIKISGPINRAILKTSEQNKPYGHLYAYDPYNPVHKTYQTVSSTFGHLRLLEAIKRFNLDKIETPNSGIISINNARPHSPNSCDDKNCVFVEKIIKREDGYIPIHEIKNKHTVFDKETIRQLVIATLYAGLWDLNSGNLFVNEKKGTIAIIDTEQPNNTKLSQMFNKDIQKYALNIADGIKKLVGQFPENSKQRIWIHTYYEEYKNKFITNNRPF